MEGEDVGRRGEVRGIEREVDMGSVVWSGGGRI